MGEVLSYHQKGIENSDVLDRLDLKAGTYFIVSIHREENVDSKDNFTNLLDTLNAIADRYQWPVIVSTHPRTRKQLGAMGYQDHHEKIRFLKPQGYYDYIKLQTQAACVISDSGTITEEASILGFPAITIRQAHERPEGMDEGTLVMSGLARGRILESIAIVTAHAATSQRPFQLVGDYKSNNVSKKIVRLIISYTDYVNRTVWHKEG
jgi:UDP-N-acetylglucosamine 2-epimerase (non-hydrolysing)